MIEQVWKISAIFKKLLPVWLCPSYMEQFVHDYHEAIAQLGRVLQAYPVMTYDE